ncbi:MAG: autotransporter-associated beta strand repeat-containing protein, partial [Verrucomicrobiota bacterium]
ITIPDNGGGTTNKAPQAGVTNVVDVLNIRAQAAVYMRSNLWFAITAGPAAGPSQVYYYRLNANEYPSGSPVQVESGPLGEAGNWNYQPALGGNYAGDMAVVYTRSSSTSNPAMMYCFRGAADGAFGSPQVVVNSGGPSVTTGSKPWRWGDFAAVSADPVDGSLWITHEYARSSAANNWGTWFAQISVPLPSHWIGPGRTETFSGTGSLGTNGYEISGGTTEVQHGSPGVTSTLARTAGGKIQLLNSATAATSTITIGGGPGNGGSGGVLEFRDQTTAAAATITSGSGVLGPNFDELTPNPIDGFGGAANFYDTSLAGTARFTNNGEGFRGGTGGSAGFFNNASGDHGVFNNKAAATDLGRGGVTQFTDTATAGFATFINDGSGLSSDFSGGETIFYLSSNAGHGTFTNKGATLYQSAQGRYAAAGATRFLGSSSAASGTFFNEGVGYQVARGVTQFFDTSTAGTGTFTNLAGASDGGAVEFYNQSTAGDGVFVNDTTSSTLTAGGEFSFNDNSTAGTGHFSSTGTYGGHVTFNNQSSADHATIMLTPNQPNNRIDFRGSSTAGNSILQIGAGGLVAFQANSTAANATITIGANAVGTSVSSGQAQGAFFSGTAGSSQISVVGGEMISKQGSAFAFFNPDSTAGNATISVSGAKNGGITGGQVIFETRSHAGNATLIASGETNADINTAGTISFRGGAQGDLCRVIAETGGWFDCSGNGIYGGTAIGSIEGAGRINLGAALLTVGSANTSTIFLGPITQGQGYTPGIGGRLTKTGIGALTLAGVNTYTGLTTINAGTLAVNGSLAGGVQVNAGATLKGTGTIAGTVTVAPGGIVAPGNSPGTLTIGKDYSQGSQGILAMEVAGPNPENQDLLIVNGNVNLGGTLLLIFSGYAPSASETFPVVEATGNLSVNNLNIVVLGLKPGFQLSYQVSAGKLILTATSVGQLRTTIDPIQALSPWFTSQSGFVYPVFTLAGATYQFDTSTDLSTWTRISELQGANNLFEFRQIPSAGEPHRFYRVIQVSGTP